MRRLRSHGPAEGGQHRIVLAQIDERALPAVHWRLDHDQPGVCTPQGIGVQPAFGVSPGRSTDDQGIGVAQQRRQARPARLAAQVRHKATLASVQDVEGRGSAKAFTRWGLNFDDVGPEVAEQHRRERSPGPFAAIQNAYSAKRALHDCLLTFSAAPAALRWSISIAAPYAQIATPNGS